MKILKRIAVVLLAALVALPAMAEGVSRERAAETAAAFFQGRAKRASTSAGVRINEAAVESSAYAAFNRDGGGFVVVALNDAVPPVLAYSHDGRFPSKEEMPAPMAWWFSQLEEQLNALGEDAVATNAVRAQWNNPTPLRGTSKLYETASWYQRAPFNLHCPVLNGQNCITGCVATAGSILARFFRWPDAGVGTISAKPSNVPGPNYPSHSLGYAYDWDNMPLDYDSGYNDAQAEAVATLMYDMGTMAEMWYGLDGSSASTETLLAGFKKYMKYDKGAYMADRSDYSDNDWKQLLRDVLDNYGPTLYSGDDIHNYGGHTFILDGYDAEGRFHFNWGWGFADCYCELTSLAPADTPYDFADDQQVVVGLVPDYDGTSTGRDWLTFLAINTYTGLSASTTNFVKNVYFSCTAGGIVPKVNAFDGSLYFSLYDKNGNFKQDISNAYPIQIAMNAIKMFGLSCRITCDIAPGDRIKVRYVGQNNEGIIDSGAGCTTEIIVMEDIGGGDEPDPTAGYTAAETAASTALYYDKDGKTLTLTFAHPANWAVKNTVGTTMASGTATEAGPVAINFSGYASGTYTVSIGSTEDPFSFTITK